MTLKTKVRCKLVVIFVMFLYLLCFYGVTAWARQPEETNCLIQGWPSEFSDLAPDESLSRGSLANGLRYVFKQNTEPKDRVVFYLLVKAGSFNETGEQRGLAHFLEHMMFNGTEHFPPGTLINYFQSIGMEFGGDTNAFTSYDRTVYTIVLPDGSGQNLDKGLLVLSDFAGRALLTEQEIDKERGVIFSEKRARDSAEHRSRVASTENSFAGTRLPLREIIGVDTTLEKADRAILKSFYDTWYRPDNMVLVAVGDFDEEVVKALVTKHFGSLAPRSESHECYDFGSVGSRQRQPFYYSDKELGKTEVAIENFWDEGQQHDSVALQKNELLKYLSGLIMNYRLESITENPQAPFAESTYYSGDIVDRIGYSVIKVTAKDDNWQDSLAKIETVRRQALEFGFSKEELGRAKTEIRTQLKNDVETEKTRDSRKIARDIVDHLASDRVYMSPHQELALYGAMLDNIAVSDINETFRKDWDVKNLLVSVNGSAAVIGDAQQVIATAYNKARKETVRKPEEYGEINFPYLAVEEGTVTNPVMTDFPKIGVKRYGFPNGLIINFKKTAFEDKNIRISANFGSGRLAEPQPGMAMLAERIINDSGTGKLSQTDLDRLTAGSTARLEFDVAESTFSWSGQALQDDFGLLVELLYTHLFDHGFRKNIYDRNLAELQTMYKRLNQDVDGAFPLQIQKFIAGGSEQFGMPSYGQLQKVSFSDLSRWVDQIYDLKDLEISVVGDFDETKSLTLLAKYFAHHDFSEPLKITVPEIQFPMGAKLTVDVSTSLDKALVTVSWPTDDGTDIKRARRMHVLAAILEDRLLEKLRESLGATYSPGSYSYGSRMFQNYGYIMAQMTVAPADIPVVVDEILAIGADLAKSGVTEDELIRARDPLVTSVKESVATNGYWMQSVLSLSSRHPEQLVWPESIVSDFSGISKEEIDTLAQKFFHTDRAAIAIAKPAVSADLHNEVSDEAAVKNKVNKSSHMSP